LRANHSFLTGISKLRRLIIKERIKRVLTVTFLLSLMLNTLALGVQKIGLLRWEGYTVYPILVLVSFAFSLLFGLRTIKSFMDELIEIDVRLGLKERLSTAYECHQLGRKSVFVDGLIEDATSLLGSIKAHEIFPRSFSSVHLCIPLLAAAIVILLSIDLAPTPTKDSATGERLKQIGRKMEEYSKREIQGIKEEAEKPRSDVSRHMENITEELKSKTMTKERLLKSLAALIKEVEAEQTQLAHRLEAELGLEDMVSTPKLKPLQKENVSPNEVKQLREQLEELFEGEVPASLSQDISSLDQNRRLEVFLDDIINEVGFALEVDDEVSFREEEKGVSLGGTFGEGKNNDKEISGGRALAPLESDEVNTERQITSVLGQAKASSKGSGEGDPAPDEVSSYAAGREKSEGGRKPPYQLRSSKGPVLEDRGNSGQGDWYNIHVRSLPAKGKAGLMEEDVIRPYRRELEGALRKEDIPLNYREYIKNYFLSIGLRQEENGDDEGN
jgi:hypothetical protein